MGLVATPEELNRTGMEAYKAGRFPEAIQAYEEALAAKPDYVACWINLAVALTKRERFDDAIRAGQKAVALAPQLGPARYHLGNALAAKGRWNEAVSEYARAFDLDKGTVTGLALAGHLCMDHGLTQKALEFWRTFLATAPADHPRRAEVEAEMSQSSGGPSLISKF